jgi:hypothetical protein
MKTPYEKPRLVPLDEAMRADGANCFSGSSAGDGHCDVGNIAGSLCLIGYSATMGCINGSAPGGICAFGTGN